MLRMLQNRPSEAQLLLERAIAIEPNYPPAQHALSILKQRAASPTAK
jgi:hypothetical protein